MKRAIVLLSGGLDSTTCMALADSEGYKICALSFDYGQRHKRELQSSIKVAEYYRVESHKIIKLDNLGGSALTDLALDVPDYNGSNSIPITYVPSRNLIFLSYAGGLAETLNAQAIFIGVNALDYSGYPDCRPEFINAFKEALRFGTKKGIEGTPIEILTPLINLSKSEIVQLACKHKAPLNLTTSCYRGGDKACGNCDRCILRKKGFKEAGMPDPIEYV